MRKVPCEVYSRIVGYFRPVQAWNVGKQEEFKDRVTYSTAASLSSPLRGSNSWSPAGGVVLNMASRAVLAPGIAHEVLVSVPHDPVEVPA